MSALRELKKKNESTIKEAQSNIPFRTLGLVQQ
jgi:hypothetical protein